MYEAPTAPLSIGQVLDDGFRLFRAAFKHVWHIALIGAITTFPIVFVSDQLDPINPSIDQFATFFVVLIVVGFVSLYFYAVLFARIGAESRGEAMTTGQAYVKGLRRAPAFIVVTIAYFLMIGFVMFLFMFLIAMIIGVIAGVSGGGAGDAVPIAAAIGTFVGLALSLVPIAYVSTIFAFCFGASVVDSKGPFSSLGYSARIVQGHFWRTAAIILVIFFIYSVVYMILGVLAAVVAFDQLAGTGTPGPLSHLVNYVLGPIFQLVLIPLVIAMVISAYNDLRLRHEGSDLAARIAAAT